MSTKNQELRKEKYNIGKIAHKKLLEEIKQIDFALSGSIKNNEYYVFFSKKDGSVNTSERFAYLISEVITDKLPLLLRLLKKESEVYLEKARKKARREARKFLKSTFRKK